MGTARVRASLRVMFILRVRVGVKVRVRIRAIVVLMFNVRFRFVFRATIILRVSFFSYGDGQA